MTREEIASLLEVMAAAYPNAKIGDAKRTVDAWQLAFGESDAGHVYKAARVHMSRCKFFPTIADITQCMKYAFIYNADSVASIEDGRKPVSKVVDDLLCNKKCEICKERGSCLFKVFVDIENDCNERMLDSGPRI